MSKNDSGNKKSKNKQPKKKIRKVLAKAIKGELTPSQLFPILFLFILALIILFVILSPILFNNRDIYRRNVYIATDKDKVYDKELNDIYREGSYQQQFNSLNELKNQSLEKNGYVPEPILDAEKKLEKTGLEKISTVKELTSNDPFKYLPDFEKLIEVYEKLPSITIGSAMEDLKASYTDALRSGEVENLSRYHDIYAGYTGIFWGKQTAITLKEIGDKMIRYLNTRLKIAKETDDIVWAYEIIKETYALYKDIEYKKLPNTEQKIRPLINEVVELYNTYSKQSEDIRKKIEVVKQIYYSATESIENKVVRLNEILKEASETDKALRLVKEIRESKALLAEKSFEYLKDDIRHIIREYKEKDKIHLVLNEKTIPELNNLLKQYSEKELVKNYPARSQLIKVMHALNYLKIISGDNTFVVKLNSIELSKPIEELKMYIGTYPADKGYDGRHLFTYDSVKVDPEPNKIINQNEDVSYVYEYNEELFFPYNIGEQIIIRFKSDNQYVLSLEGNDRTRNPIRYKLPNERGNPFIILDTDIVLFKWKDESYKMTLKIGTETLPEYPALFSELF